MPEAAWRWNYVPRIKKIEQRRGMMLLLGLYETQAAQQQLPIFGADWNCRTGKWRTGKLWNEGFAVPCYRLSRWGVGPFRLPVPLRRTLYLIVSVIQHWVLTVLGNYLKRNYLRVINTLNAVEMLHDVALNKSTIDIDIGVNITMQICTSLHSEMFCLWCAQ